MRAVDLIAKKRDGLVLTEAEIDFLIQGFTQEEIPDYQMSSLLMAIFLKGMSEEEIFSLVRSMIGSGQALNLSSIPGPTADKHSTGGVGDKVSLVFVPLIAACGMYIAKMSGRGLGHTGGTIDKLEAIPGFRTDIPTRGLLNQVREIGCAIVSQTADLVPADGKLYALRDVTATVASLPLIASSVMSKKIAGGAENILIDVKCGGGAFMKTKEEAMSLARLMVRIGDCMQRKVTCVLSPMDEPLGYAIGNALEVKEAIDTLQGKGPHDFVNAVIDLAAELLALAGLVPSLEVGRERAREALAGKSALKKFKEMIRAQGGEPRIVTETWRLPQASFRWITPAKKEGFISRVDALKIGQAAMLLGAGRLRKEDPIDHAVGVLLQKKRGDWVSRHEPLAILFATAKENLAGAQYLVERAFSFSQKPVPLAPTFLGKVSNRCPA